MKKFLPLLLLFTFIGSGCSLFQDSAVQKKAQLYYQYGTAALAQANYTEALNNLIKAEQLSPDDSKIQNNLGMAYYFKEAKEKALHHLKRSLEIDPDNSDARNNLASVYLNQEQYELAEKEYLKILNDLVYPAHYRVYYNLGVISARKRNEPQAIEYYQKSVQENNNYCPAHFQLGMIRYRNQNYVDALEHFKGAVSGICYDRSALPHYYRGLSYLKTSQREKARETFEFIIGKFKDDPYVLRARLRLKRLNSFNQMNTGLDELDRLDSVENPPRSLQKLSRRNQTPTF